MKNIFLYFFTKLKNLSYLLFYLTTIIITIVITMMTMIVTILIMRVKILKPQITALFK